MTGTTRMPVRAPATLAVDIGGANTKAAWLDGTSLRTVSRPFEVWRDRQALSGVLRDVAADVASANWVATALAVADAHPDALLIDVGSTTTDVVPIVAGRVAATGHNDLERLLAGELVYTGVLRTNLAAIAPRVPVRGGWCPVSSEYFAISADVYLVLGRLAREAYDCPTPDGRPITVAFARERIARLVCADLEQLGDGDVDTIAAFLHGEQLRQ